MQDDYPRERMLTLQIGNSADYPHCKYVFRSLLIQKIMNCNQTFTQQKPC